MSQYTPEQLRKLAQRIDSNPLAGIMPAQLRAHADALEKLKVAEEALKWMADERNWLVEECEIKRSNDTGGKRFGIVMVSRGLRPWIFASLAVYGKRFPNVYCSSCGREFGPGDNGFSHCENHAALATIREDDHGQG